MRETCAQTLGVALAQLRADRVRLVAARVATLARQPQWEARHGALLAFKYLLAARQVSPPSPTFGNPRTRATFIVNNVKRENDL